MDFKTVNHFITFIKYKMVHIFVEATKTITNFGTFIYCTAYKCINSSRKISKRVKQSQVKEYLLFQWRHYRYSRKK